MLSDNHLLRCVLQHDINQNQYLHNPGIGFAKSLCIWSKGSLCFTMTALALSEVCNAAGKYKLVSEPILGFVISHALYLQILGEYCYLNFPIKLRN